MVCQKISFELIAVCIIHNIDNIFLANRNHNIPNNLHLFKNKLGHIKMSCTNKKSEKSKKLKRKACGKSLIPCQSWQKFPKNPVVEKKIIGYVEQFHPGLKAVLNPSAKLLQIIENTALAEGPLWCNNGKDKPFLLFSDVDVNTIYKWNYQGKHTSIYMRPSGYTGCKQRAGGLGSNGLTFDSDGLLVIAEHGDRRITKLCCDGTKVVLAAHYHGRRLNSPNDMAYRSNGDLYFTDPTFGLVGGPTDPAKELPFSGVFRLSKKTGKLHLLTKELTFPNGIAFSPDEKVLYVANSDVTNPIVMAYDVLPSGKLAGGHVLFDSSKFIAAGDTGLPDGLKVDKTGVIFSTGPGGIAIINPDGVLLGRVRTDGQSTNVGWGEDGSVLYLTKFDGVAKIQTRTSGTILPCSIKGHCYCSSTPPSGHEHKK